MNFHPSLRLKLSAAFAGAMAVLLAGLGLFIYSRYQGALDRSLNDGLRSRVSYVRALVAQADTGLADSPPGSLSAPSRGFAQILRGDGSVLDTTPGLAGVPMLGSGELLRIAGRSALIDRASAPGVEGPVRLFVSPAHAQGQRLVLVVGTSLKDRNAALGELSALMVLGGPIALLLASVLGYAVSALSLRSVEAMRRRASVISVTQPGQRLPVPAASDELQRLAMTLNDMLERNEAAFTRERQFVADASHELRTPLSVLKAELEVALTGQSSEHELRAALRSADCEAERVIRLAQDLLTLAQADHGTLPLNRADVSLKPILERIQRRFAPRAREMRRAMVASAADDLMVSADPLRIDQAVSTLVDNALRHGDGTVVLSAHRDGATVEIHVADEGPGFPEAFRDLAFERFSRAAHGRTQEGTGLGLAIVKSIARAHGAEVHASNRLTGGADVCLSLSGDSAAPARTSAPQRASRCTEDRATV